MEEQTEATTETGNEQATSEQFDPTAPIPLSFDDSVTRDTMLGGGPQIELPNQKVSEKTDKDPEKESQESEAKDDPKEGQSKKSESTEDELDFSGKVGEKLKGLELTEEEQEQFVSDVLENWPKWTKGNTEKSMAIKAREKELGDLEALQGFAENVSSEEVKNAIEAVKSNEDIMEVVSDLFDEEENPLTQLLSLFDKAESGAEKLTEAQKQHIEREEELKIREEILELEAIKDSPFDYSDQEQKVETGKIADKYGINLVLAHYIRAGLESGNQVSDLKKKISILEKELKGRPKETVLPKKDQEPDFTGSHDIQVPLTVEEFNMAMDETDRRVREKLGIE